VGRSIGDACALAKTSREASTSATMVHQAARSIRIPRGFIAYVERVAEAGGALPLMFYRRIDGIGQKTLVVDADEANPTS
jgi:4-hydroxy-tetrahydrodipicolinate synthase